VREAQRPVPVGRDQPADRHLVGTRRIERQPLALRREGSRQRRQGDAAFDGHRHVGRIVSEHAVETARRQRGVVGARSMPDVEMRRLTGWNERQSGRPSGAQGGGDTVDAGRLQHAPRDDAGGGVAIGRVGGVDRVGGEMIGEEISGRRHSSPHPVPLPEGEGTLYERR
jgi:hypothetical protein